MASATTKQGTTAPSEPPTISPVRTVEDLLAMPRVGEGPIRKVEKPQTKLEGTMKKRLSIH